MTTTGTANRRRVATGLPRAAAAPDQLWRRLTAARRPWPDFLILGTQRGGTTSLYRWLSAHPSVLPASRKEIHYFDLNYARGEGWYRAHFPPAHPGRVTGEASPYLLFHPLAPARAATDLPASTRFIVLLREPVERAVSHYWHERRLKAESLSLADALAAEGERLAGQVDRVAAGQRSFAHFHFSYAARGRYASQLERWFAAVGRERVLVVESESLFTGSSGTGLSGTGLSGTGLSGTTAVTQWLGLPDGTAPFPIENEARRDDHDTADAAALAALTRSFESDNEELFALLGRRLWVR